MNDLISRQAVIGMLEDEDDIRRVDVISTVDLVSREKYDKLKNRYMLCKWEKMCLEEMQPKVDAVEVVRCKDCKHWSNSPICPAFPHFHECHEWNERISTSENDYCSKGVRKEKGYEK